MKVFDKELVSLIIYGSAASGHYIQGKSDINLLVVVTPAGIDSNRMFWIRSGEKRHVAMPLIMTKDFILCSLDSFPIEFLNMKNNHVLIYGENVKESFEL